MYLTTPVLTSPFLPPFSLTLSWRDTFPSKLQSEAPKLGSLVYDSFDSSNTNIFSPSSLTFTSTTLFLLTKQP